MGWGPSGARGGDVVVAVAPGEGLEVGLVRVDPSSGVVRWKLTLGQWLFDDFTSADGRLPRQVAVVPFGSQTEHGPMPHEVVVVDLDAGAITSRNRVDSGWSPFVTPEGAYLLSTSRPTVLALDPATGALASASSVRPTSRNEARVEDFRFGRLWLMGMGWGGPSELGRAVIDLDHSKPLYANGEVEVQDVSDRGWQLAP